MDSFCKETVMDNCYLCGSSDVHFQQENISKIIVKCQVCGVYIITPQARFLLKREGVEKHILTALTRQSWEAEVPITITTENMAQLIDSAPKFSSPLENINLLLLLAIKKQGRADALVRFNPWVDYPLIFVHDGDEFVYILNTLFNQGFLENHKEDGGWGGSKADSRRLEIRP